MGLGERVVGSWRGGASPWATVVLVACGLVLLHYWVNWFRATRPLPRMHHPLALMYLAAQRLWRNRSLVGIVLGLALIGAVAWHFWLGPVFFLQRGVVSAGGLLGGLFVFSPQQFPAVWAGVQRDLVGAELRQWPPQPVGFALFTPLGASSLVASLALGTALALCWARQPTWLPPGLYRRLAWPTALTVDAAALTALEVYLGSYRAEVPPLLGLAAVACLGPAVALAWSLTWQVAQGRQWSLYRAVRDLLRYWPTVLVAVVGMELVFDVFTFPLMFPLPHIEWLFVALPVMAKVVWAFFFCLPWVIVGDGLGLREALAEVVNLWRRHWRDLAIFVPRYMVIMLLVGIPFTLLANITHGGLITGFLSDALRLLFRLVGALAVVIWYVEARKLRRGGAPVVAAPSGDLVAMRQWLQRTDVYRLTRNWWQNRWSE